MTAPDPRFERRFAGVVRRRPGRRARCRSDPHGSARSRRSVEMRARAAWRPSGASAAQHVVDQVDRSRRRRGAELRSITRAQRRRDAPCPLAGRRRRPPTVPDRCPADARSRRTWRARQPRPRSKASSWPPARVDRASAARGRTARTALACETTTPLAGGDRGDPYRLGATYGGARRRSCTTPSPSSAGSDRCARRRDDLAGELNPLSDVDADATLTTAGPVARPRPPSAPCSARIVDWPRRPTRPPRSPRVTAARRTAVEQIGGVGSAHGTPGVSPSVSRDRSSAGRPRPTRRVGSCGRRRLRAPACRAAASGRRRCTDAASPCGAAGVARVHRWRCRRSAGSRPSTASSSAARTTTRCRRRRC